ncbi:alpha/beta hydrolase family protein [Aureitalea marina]|uniref:Alpha/beta hydrolase n=1 Tax=Aureitalea marina TaxID=930804 RepID=A0A2S7KS10_9FLAO|nr:alpha/beta fold hydrolase [Aureitalea marina]PQB05368.1 alpha/beta hydrolase [Aureitalea marina]
MKIQLNQVLNKWGKRPVLWDSYWPSEEQTELITIFCHGYKGFKDWGGWHLVAEEFALSGMPFIKFNFSHNGGTIDQPVDFPDLDAFAENNYSLEMADLQRMIMMINERYGARRIALVGHSRGGGITLLKAAEEDQVKKVITWAGVSDFKVRFQVGSPEFELWREKGITHIENTRTGQFLPHNWQFYEDFMENEARLTISRAVRQLQIPQLIIHGSDDPTVNLSEAHAIHSWNSNSKLEIIPGADHVFGMQHPWKKEELPAHMKDTVALTKDFIINA